MSSVFAFDFGEIEIIPNSFNPSLPTHNDAILDIDNLSSDVSTSGTVSGIVGDFVYLENTRTDESGDIVFKDNLNASTSTATFAKVGIGTATPSYPLEILMASDDTRGIFIDQNTNNYTGTSANIGLHLDKTVSTANSNDEFDSLGIQSDLVVSHALTGGIVSNPIEHRAIGSNLTVNGAHANDDGSFDETNYAGKFSASRSGTITSADNNNMSNYGTFGGITESVSFDNAGDLLTIANYGGKFSVDQTGTETAGTLTKKSYGLYGSVNGNTSGTTTAYGVYALATGADTNWDIYIAGSGNFGSSTGTINFDDENLITTGDITTTTGIITGKKIEAIGDSYTNVITAKSNIPGILLQRNDGNSASYWLATQTEARLYYEDGNTLQMQTASTADMEAGNPYANDTLRWTLGATGDVAMTGTLTGLTGLTIASGGMTITAGDLVASSSTATFGNSTITGDLICDDIVSGNNKLTIGTNSIMDFTFFGGSIFKVDALGGLATFTDVGITTTMSIIAGGDIKTTGSGDDLWLGNNTQASANFQAYATGETRIDADDIQIKLGEGQDVGIEWDTAGSGDLLITSNDVTAADEVHFRNFDSYDFDSKIVNQELVHSATGPTDNLDVSGVNVILINANSNAVTIGGFVGGIRGQVLYIAINNAGNNVTLEHAEGTGNQDIYLRGGADDTIAGTNGGWVLVCNGAFWADAGH